MRLIHFYKYQGTGNDFILIDNRLNTFPKEDTKLVAQLCERRFGVGGDAMHNTVKGGHDPAIREHDPWKLPRRGARCRAPRTAHGLKASTIDREKDARKDQG